METFIAKIEKWNGSIIGNDLVCECLNHLGKIPFTEIENKLFLDSKAIVLCRKCNKVFSYMLILKETSF